MCIRLATYLLEYEGIVSTDDHEVRIGVADIYRELQSVAANVNTLIAKFDTAQAITASELATVRAELVTRERICNDHEMRIRTLEQQPVVTTRNMWTGVGVLIAALSVLVGALAMIIDTVGH